MIFDINDIILFSFFEISYREKKIFQTISKDKCIMFGGYNIVSN